MIDVVVPVWMAYVGTGLYVATKHRGPVYWSRGVPMPWWETVNSLFGWPYWAFRCYFHGHIVTRVAKVPHSTIDASVGQCLFCGTRLLVLPRGWDLHPEPLILSLENDDFRNDFERMHRCDVDALIEQAEEKIR